MSQEDALDLPQDTYVEPTKLELLKQKARTLGITFRDNISEKTLENKIDAHLEELEEAQQAGESLTPTTTAVETVTKAVAKTSAEIIAENRKKANLLHRVVINPVDPRRSQLKGELVTVGNSQLGFIAKFVPFNVDSGYHIPDIILKDLRARTFTDFYKVTDKDGNEHTRTRQRKAFVVEVLESITQEELDAIRARQQGQASD